MTFQWLNKQGVRSPDGFEVQFVGRFELEYRENGRSIVFGIEDLCGVPRTLPYTQRVAALLERGIGMWDVCASAHRPGSLDSSIARESIVANDFARLYRRCPGIELVCFNGATAAALYRRLVLPTLDAAAAQLRYVVLPSTSPAHASMRYAEKLERWRAVTTAAAARRRT